MTAADTASEPLHELAASRSQGKFARYAPQKPLPEDQTIVNIGGYERLRDLAEAAGARLSRDTAGLVVLDGLIDSSQDDLAPLANEIGMFYGDVLTHSVRGSYWTSRAGSPSVCVSTTLSVDVLGVARRRVHESHPSLRENYRHVLELTDPS